MTDSLRERLIANVVTTLTGVTVGNGYASTIAAVTRGQLSPVETFGFPFASVVPTGDVPDYGAQVLRRVLSLTIMLWIDDTPATAPATLEALLADVEGALSVDFSRGGVAEHTLEQGVQYIYHPSTERLAGAGITFDIHYRTKLDDPLSGV